MQNGSITRSKRLKGPDVWEFGWWESGPDDKRKHRRMVVGSIRQFADQSAALRTISALRRDINLLDWLNTLCKLAHLVISCRKALPCRGDRVPREESTRPFP
jgi:hypothetical protein